VNTQVAETVVIGSGFAGSVVAAKLTDAGQQVTMLERGPWRDTDAVRKQGITETAPLPQNRHLLSHGFHRINHPRLPGGSLRLKRDGFFELQVADGLDILCTSNVGGGSHVYGGLNMRPAAAYWDNHHQLIDDDCMARHYDFIFEKMGSIKLQANTYPNMFPDRMRDSGLFISDARAFEIPVGLSVTPQTDHASMSASGLLGSRDGLKTTMDCLFLLPALRKGLTLKDRCEVLGLYRVDEGARVRYRIHYRDAEGKNTDLLAERLVLAAGTLNTLRLLLKSRDELRGLQAMPALGKRISGNADFAAYWQCGKPGDDISVGLPTRGQVLLRNQDDWRSDHSWPDIVEGSLPYSAHLPPLPMLRRFARLGSLLATMGDDGMPGHASWHPRKGLQINYPAENVAFFQTAKQALDTVADISGMPLKHFPKAMSMHPMGGACLADNEIEGVVDYRGAVYGQPNLYIADGSVMPAALGVAPSMSIAAWAGNVAEQLINARH
jgi:cholesterol oxidase